MTMQRVLARLSPLLIMSNRDYIPSFKSTLSATGEQSWKEMLQSVALEPIDSAQIFRGKRLIMFGEQHHQSQVLRAQLLVLEALHQHRGSNVVMVLEHFNFQQDELLSRFSQGHISNEELLEEYGQSQEGFRLMHYLPLLLLARELGIPVHGGFPPRQWASVVYKESLEALRISMVDLPKAFNDERWSQVSHISPEQVAYLKSMMSGEAPVLPDSQHIPKDGYSKGILPAQTLKDTFFAWTIDKHLQNLETVVYAVCGLGHAEFDLCTTPRLRRCSPDEVLLFASKEWSSTEYAGQKGKVYEANKLADVIVPYTSDE